jgi:hypothetical protein
MIRRSGIGDDIFKTKASYLERELIQECLHLWLKTGRLYRFFELVEKIDNDFKKNIK